MASLVSSSPLSRRVNANVGAGRPISPSEIVFRSPSRVSKKIATPTSAAKAINGIMANTRFMALCRALPHQAHAPLGAGKEVEKLLEIRTGRQRLGGDIPVRIPGAGYVQARRTIGVVRHDQSDTFPPLMPFGGVQTGPFSLFRAPEIGLECLEIVGEAQVGHADRRHGSVPSETTTSETTTAWT